MNGGHACLTIEETKSAGFHADVRSLCDALGTASEPPPSSGRSEAATQPYTDPFADTLASPASFTSESPDWCVDMGTMLVSMTTFELWEALERGHVLAWMRVWREGMECWTAVGEIAELACAIAGTPQPPAEPEALPEPPAEARTGPLCTPPVTVEPAPESSIRPLAAHVSGPLYGARWIAIGSAVALAALVSAIVVHRDPPPAPPAETETAGASPPMETTQPSRPAEDVPAPEAAHRDERGQRRLPRGGRRAYGR